MSNKNKQQPQQQLTESVPEQVPVRVFEGPLADAVRVCLQCLLSAARYGTVKRDFEGDIQAAIASLE